MVLKRFRGGRSEEAQPKPAGGSDEALGLAALLRQGVVLQPDREALLKEALDKGLEFFERFNTSRLELAFGAFDDAMRKALFEVLYLLHINDPGMAEYKFTGVKLQHKSGTVREIPYDAVASLYVEDAPYGVEGIGGLSPVFEEAFQAHIREVFGTEVSPQSGYGFCPIVSIHSLGSIGTVGHKSRASDLDLQVQYELTPFLVDASSITEADLRDGLNKEIRTAMGRLRVQMKLGPEALKNPATQQGLRKKAMQHVAKVFPQLYKYLIAKQGDYVQDLKGANGHALRTQLLHEIMRVLNRRARMGMTEELKKREKLIREKINRVQNYIMEKYPMAEIYLFSSANDDYREGHHGTTLESKEASGSAYELILNYETLMPGIQLTPMVPTHFVLPQMINDDAAMYDRIVDYIRFNALGMFSEVRPRLTNLGRTPDMDIHYVATHAGATYWEAFKASSGNLPKALLNLFRYEQLLDETFRKTIIQNIKDPTYLNHYASPKPDDPSKDMQRLMEDVAGVPNWALLEMEERFPLLLQDPWWLRFKALKIGFGEEKGIGGIEPAERLRIGKIIDLAFALHVRISDVFTKPGDTRTFDTHREQVLLEFLKRAFPPVSPRRKFLEHVFVGEVRTVNEFEEELRDLFKNCLKRVNQKIAAFNIQGESNQKEFEIWFHYYQENFEPAPNVVARTILNHLKVPRGRLLVGYELKKGWFFRSAQKESSVGKRFDTFGVLDHLPAEVTVMENVSFVRGLANAVVNGYYGVLNEGTLKESRTDVEFDAKFMDLGNRTDNNMAFIRPDMVHRVVSQIMEFFPYQPYHYLDCIRLKRKITEVFLLLNMTKYGRLSLLYRDNLRTWYVDEFDHADVFSQAHNFSRSSRSLLTQRALHMTLAKWFKLKGVHPGEIKLTAWVNPNSVETNHSGAQIINKENELRDEFLQIIGQVHKPRNAKTAPVPDHPPAEQAAEA